MHVPSSQESLIPECSLLQTLKPQNLNPKSPCRLGKDVKKLEDVMVDLKGVEFSRELVKALEYHRGMLVKMLRDMKAFSEKSGTTTDEKMAYLEAHKEESKQAYACLREGQRRCKTAGLGKAETKTQGDTASDHSSA